MSIRQTVVRFLFVLGVLLAVGPTLVAAQATPEASPISGDRIQLGADWILSQEAADGGWIGFNGTSDAGTTIDAVLALAAARNAGATVDLTNAQTFLEANGAAYALTGSGAAAKLTMAVVAMGLDGRNFAGIDPLGLATADYNIDTKL
ncbi:MAG TPA: hypothetical protein PK691_13600, partial [Thermomicrobiales bacterium]|nr:hypothetical protein [Thermomicrobiales bacterium]